MAEHRQRSIFIDDEAECSTETTDTEDEIMNDIDKNFIDDSTSSSSTDLSSHRILQNKLQRTDSVNLHDIIQQRHEIDLRTAHDDILPDSPWEIRNHNIPLHVPLSPTSQNDTGISDYYNDWTSTLDNMDIPEIPKPTTTTSTNSQETEPPNTTTIVARKPHGRHKKSFELRHKTVFLTYPQCTIDKSEMLQHLITLLIDKTPKIIVAHENHHKTEGQHLHVYIQCETAITTHNERYFDYKSYHPNIKLVTKREGIIKYCCKDNDITTHNIDVSSYLNDIQKHKNHLSNEVASSIQHGTTFSEISKKYPGFAMIHRRVIMETINDYEQNKLNEERKSKWSKIAKFTAGDGDFTNMRIAGWINDHILQPHKFRDQCLWIKGPTKCGKSSLIQFLHNQGLNILMVDVSSGFYDGISNNTQLIVFDEYKAQKTITEMNKLCDGSLCRLNIKGSSYQLTKPIPVIVLSNFSIKEAYHNSDQQHLDTLIGRFLYLEITEHAHIRINCITTED